MNITLYTKANCPQCTATKRQLDKRGLPYTTVDITANARISDRLRNEGWRQMPVIIADDESWSGYRPDKIRLFGGFCGRDSGERVGVLLVGIGQYDTLRRRMPIG